MFELVEAEKAQFPIEVLCEVLGVSRSGYYAWKARPPSDRSKEDARLAVEIAAAHKKSKKRYGSPRVHRALRRKGLRVGKKRVERLMREKGIVGRRKRRFRKTTDSNHTNPIAPNVVARNFEPAAPNQVWAGDVTYVATGLSPAPCDVCSAQQVGWMTRIQEAVDVRGDARERFYAPRPSRKWWSLCLVRECPRGWQRRGVLAGPAEHAVTLATSAREFGGEP